MIVPGGGFLLPSSRVPVFVPGGMVMDEIDTCIFAIILTLDFIGLHPYMRQE